MNSIRFETTILGSNSALPAHGRHPTSQVLNHNEKLFLLDCGEGTQMQLSAYKIKRSKIDHIFITHLHGDHYYGLIGLLTSYHLLRREEALHLFAPKGLKEILDLNFHFSDTRLFYELIVHEWNPEGGEMIFENDELSVTSIAMKHRIPCVGFLFHEKKQRRKIIPEKLSEYNIPHFAIRDLKDGKDISVGEKNFRNDELTVDPPAPRTYAFCSDTLYNEDIIPAIEQADLLYHESTFMNESLERAVITFHSTTLQAATIAKKANVKKLLIGHYSAKYIDLAPMLLEAQSVFENTGLAKEGEKYIAGE